MGDVSQRSWEEAQAAPEGEEELRARVRQAVRRVQDGLERTDYRIRTLVNERPLTAVAVAIGLGYVAGRVVSRIRGWRHD